jgi:phage/plasmid-associated DNA primase
VIGFVDEMCEVTRDDEDYIVRRDLYDKYTEYCKASKITAIKDNVFGSELALLHIKKDRVRINYDRQYVYTGIKLRN